MPIVLAKARNEDDTVFRRAGVAQATLHPSRNLNQCAELIARPLRRRIQEDGRIRHWGRVVDGRHRTTRVLRVVTLDDGETIHNAFFDRDFRENEP